MGTFPHLWPRCSSVLPSLPGSFSTCGGMSATISCKLTFCLLRNHGGGTTPVFPGVPIKVSEQGFIGSDEASCLSLSQSQCPGGGNMQIRQARGMCPLLETGIWFLLPSLCELRLWLPRKSRRRNGNGYLVYPWGTQDPKG